LAGSTEETIQESEESTKKVPNKESTSGEKATTSLADDLILRASEKFNSFLQEHGSLENMVRMQIGLQASQLLLQVFILFWFCGC